MTELPEELMVRFRTIAMERLEKIDTAWTLLTREAPSSDVESGLLRQLHTLKGDAKVVGLDDAALLCQRLEDLLSAARVRGYRVHEDVDVVVTMTIQFIAMLVRKRKGMRSAIDIDGFFRQIDEVAREWLRRASEAEGVPRPAPPALHVHAPNRIDSSSGLRLSSAATSVFLEMLRASPEGQPRLHDVWTSLVVGLVESQRTPIDPLVHGYVETAHVLATDLGKAVTAVVNTNGISVCAETADALGVVLLHAIRNALDHGIEAPPARFAAGKSATGRVEIRLERRGDLIDLTVSDDGAGVDIERVRQRAVERGLMSVDVAPHAGAARVLECLFAPGFSTREVVTDVSGRGVGLDAARDAALAQGGNVELSTNSHGTTMRATVIDARGTIDVLCFKGAFSDAMFAVPSEIGVRRADPAGALAFEDLIRVTRLVSGEALAFEIFGDAGSFTVLARGAPTGRRAVRRCPTPANDLVEIVRIGDEDVVLVRPEVALAQLRQ